MRSNLRIRAGISERRSQDEVRWYVQQLLASLKMISRSANSKQRLAALTDVFSFRNSKSYKFETIFCSVLVTNPCGKMKWLRSERNLQMNGISNLQLRTRTDACTALRQIDRVSIKVHGHVSLGNTDPDTLMELKPGKAALRRKRRVFHGSHPVT